MTTISLLYEIAVGRLERGALDQAEVLLTQILAQVPEHHDAMRQLARVSVEQQRFDRAMELLGKASAAVGENADILMTLGQTYIGLGQGESAAACLERAIVLTPTVRPYRILSEAYLSMRRLDDAVEAAQRAVRLGADDAKAYAALGNALLESRRPKEALTAYDQSLGLAPDNWQAFANRGMAFLLLGRLEEAKASLSFANALNPMNPEVALPLSGILIDLDEYQEAAVLLQKLSAVMPNNPRVFTYKGISAYKQGNPTAAVGEYLKALSLDEGDVSLQLRIGDALVKEGRLDNAIGVYDQALRGAPALVDAYVQKARALLLGGDLAAGFGVLDALQEHVEAGLTAPLWDGGDVEGKALFLYAQLGMDELIVLVRCARELKKRGATVCVQSLAPSRALIAGAAGVDACVIPGDEMPDIDCQSPLERVPHLLGIAAEELTADPCFPIDEALREKWRERMVAAGKQRIGIMWQHETEPRPNVYRTVPLRLFAPLAAREDVQLFSLQTTSGVPALDSVDFTDRIHHEREIENAPLHERLAYLANLDLLIASDTLTAQAAAGAGLPVWVLLGSGPSWFYGATGDRTPWLPSARLFRQAAVGAWEGVMARVIEALG